MLLKKDDLVKKDELMVSVLNQLASEKSTLRKKASNCIGALAVVLNGQQLQGCLNDIINKIKDPTSKENMLTLIQCFSQMTRSIGNRITT